MLSRQRGACQFRRCYLRRGSPSDFIITPHLSPPNQPQQLSTIRLKRKPVAISGPKAPPFQQSYSHGVTLPPEPVTCRTRSGVPSWVKVQVPLASVTEIPRRIPGFQAEHRIHHPICEQAVTENTTAPAPHRHPMIGWQDKSTQRRYCTRCRALPGRATDRDRISGNLWCANLRTCPPRREW